MQGDVVARIGGAELVILLDGLADIEDGIHVAERILRLLRSPIYFGGSEVSVAASIGIASGAGAAAVQMNILRGADTSMYRASLLGKANVALSKPDCNATAVDRISLETRLLKCVADGELRVHYHPIVKLSDRRISGFRALAHWCHPVHGNIEPATLTDIVEKGDCIRAFGAWILEEACRQVKQWNTDRGSQISISINISSMQCCQEELVAGVIAAFESTGIDASYVVLEVSEVLTMQNVERTLAILCDLRQVGVSIGLDGFGAGYSSLAYLLRFPIDTLNIDRSFVAGIETSNERAAIVQTIINLGHNLGMSVTADGVENFAQYQMLSAWECDFGQGSFFSPGLSAEDATLVLKAQRLDSVVRSAEIL